MQRGGKLIAISTAIMGMGVLVATGIIVRGPILEEAYLKDLVPFEEERSKAAAEWFGKHGSVRAMGRLFDLARVLALRPDAEDTDGGTCNSLVRVCEALERIALRRGRDVVPLMVTILGEEPPRPVPPNDVRIGAANFLARMGVEAESALPALRDEARFDEYERFRGYATGAMAKIQSALGVKVGSRSGEDR